LPLVFKHFVLEEIIIQNYINKLSNVDAEKVVLGSLLLQKNLYYANADSLFDELFTRTSNQYIFRAICEIVEAGKDIDLITVNQQMYNAGYHAIISKENPTWGGPTEISKLTNAIASTAHFEYHVQILTDLHMLRKIQMLSMEVSQKCIGLDDPREIIATINEEVVNLINLNDEEFDKTSAIKETIDNMQSSNLDDVIKSGIYKLDDFIFGFMLCDFIIVAGATSMGKTAFALRLFLNLIMQGMYPAFFSLEMSSQQLISRLLAMISNVGLSDIRRRSLTDSQWEKMHLAVATLEEQKFTIDDKSGNLNQISNKIRKYHIKYGTKVFFIDYIQLVKVNLGKRANREQEVATISRTLKELCRELKIIIISLSQLSREVSKRTNHRPMLSDLRESGAIEQDADFVLFPYRPAYYDTFETQIPYIEDATLIIAKGRGTGLKDIDMKFISTRTNYLNGEPNEDENEDTPF
jgi:replicative DNA helicase